MSGARATDDQLRDIARYLARVCLEVERGLRPPAHLQRFLDPATRGRRQSRNAIGRFRGGPVQPRDIGTPQLSRTADEHLFVTVATSTEAGRWGALSLELRHRSGRWHVVDVQRLLAATHYRSTRRTAPASEGDGRYGNVADERRLTTAALHACDRRLGELTPDQPGHHQARDLTRRWRLTLAELDREIADLRAVDHARRSRNQVLRL